LHKEEKAMRRKIIRFANLVIPAVVMFQSYASAEVVYDSLSTTQTSGIIIREIGNTVTLSGNKRFVKKFTVNVDSRSSDIGQTNDYILRFYLPTAPGGYPGKLFWQSPPKTNVVMTGDVQAVTFEVPFIRVPDSFIFTVMQAGDGFFPLCNGPTTGNSPAYCWTNLTKEVFSSSNHLQVRIEAEKRPDATLLGTIHHSSMCGRGAEDYYTMRFEMELGGYWDLFGPAFHGITEWDEGSFLQINAEDVPEAADYLTNGTDESLRVLAEFVASGNVESNTIVKSVGIAEGYPDLYGCIITDFVLKLDNIIIDHDTPDWTYFTWDVTWEIWGIQKSSDLNRDGKVNLSDYTILASAWGSEQGQPNWNPLCDIHLPCDDKVTAYDLQRFCSDWLYGCSAGFEENFETGDFSLYGWQRSGNAYWNIVSDTVYEGTYSARSGTITHNGYSTLEVEIGVEGESISFYRKVSSETYFDYLRFYIDDVEQDKWSGNVDWSQATFPVTPGLHTFKWSYTKDGSISSGEDCAWIDQVKID
jgi:hypothetical protein